MKNKKNRSAFLFHLSNAIGIGLTILFFIYGIHSKIFTSEEALKLFLDRFGIYAPIMFIIIQLVQVIIPIIPGSISCLAGVLIFGPFMGFVYNYVGICFGSFIVFLLAKNYGLPFVKKISKPKTYAKYHKWLDHNRGFDYLFALAIFFPVAPDDFLCYLAGTTSMSFKKFATIIILGKPLSILAYSVGLHYIFNHLLNLFA